MRTLVRVLFLVSLCVSLESGLSGVAPATAASDVHNSFAKLQSKSGRYSCCPAGGNPSCGICCSIGKSAVCGIGSGNRGYCICQ